MTQALADEKDLLALKETASDTIYALFRVDRLLRSFYRDESASLKDVDDETVMYDEEMHPTPRPREMWFWPPELNDPSPVPEMEGTPIASPRSE